MFYISDINGVLSPYTEEIQRLQNEARVAAEQERIAEANIAEHTAATTDTDPTEAQAQTASATTVAPHAAAVGTAGASMLHRQGAASGAGNDRMLPKEKAALRFPHLMTRIRPAAQTGTSDKDQKAVRPNPYAKLDQEQPKRERALQAHQIMSSPAHTITKDTTIKEAGAIFEEHRFRHIPVVTKDGILIGIFSDRDYLLAKHKQDPVSTVMSTHVLSAHPDAEIREIAQILFEERISAMPIVDDKGYVLGMLTRSDILCALIHKAPLELWV